MFEKIEPTNIRFIKLGKNGCWEEKSITEEHVIRLGYEFKPETNMHEECLNDRWDKCREYCIEHWSKNSGAVTRHVNQIRDFYTLDENTLWITFYGRKLYWAFCDSTVHLDEDQTRWRKVKSNGGTWSCLDRNGDELTIDNLDGRITQVGAFRGTICDVKFKDYLIRRINGEVIKEVKNADKRFKILESSVEKLILIYIRLRRIKEFLYKLNQIQTLNSYMNIFQNLKINTILNIRKCIIFIIQV